MADRKRKVRQFHLDRARRQLEQARKLLQAAALDMSEGGHRLVPSHACSSRVADADYILSTILADYPIAGDDEDPCLEVHGPYDLLGLALQAAQEQPTKHDPNTLLSRGIRP
jgi:hypothetical protein